MQLVLNSEVRTLSDDNIRKIYGFHQEDDLHEAKQLVLKTIHELELPSSFTLDDLHRCRKKVAAKGLEDVEEGTEEDSSIKKDLFIKHLLLQLFPEVHTIPLPDMEKVSDLLKHPIEISNYSNTDVDLKFTCPKDQEQKILANLEKLGLKIFKTEISDLRNQYTVHIKVERFSLERFNASIDKRHRPNVARGV